MLRSSKKKINSLLHSSNYRYKCSCALTELVLVLSKWAKEHTVLLMNDFVCKESIICKQVLGSCTTQKHTLHICTLVCICMHR